jgi:hypothetical protein
MVRFGKAAAGMRAAAARLSNFDHGGYENSIDALQFRGNSL